MSTQTPQHKSSDRGLAPFEVNAMMFRYEKGSSMDRDERKRKCSFSGFFGSRLPGVAPRQKRREEHHHTSKKENKSRLDYGRVRSKEMIFFHTETFLFLFYPIPLLPTPPKSFFNIRTLDKCGRTCSVCVGCWMRNRKCRSASWPPTAKGADDVKSSSPAAIGFLHCPLSGCCSD